MENHSVAGKRRWGDLIHELELLEFRSVEFRTVEEAKRAVEKMHQFEYGGRKLAVKLVRDEVWRERSTASFTAQLYYITNQLLLLFRISTEITYGF
jgi:RNA recognition motif-containing protein